MYSFLVFLGKCVVVGFGCAFLGAFSAFIVFYVRPLILAAISKLRQRWIK